LSRGWKWLPFLEAGIDRRADRFCDALPRLLDGATLAECLGDLDRLGPPPIPLRSEMRPCRSRCARGQRRELPLFCPRGLARVMCCAPPSAQRFAPGAAGPARGRQPLHRGRTAPAHALLGPRSESPTRQTAPPPAHVERRTGHGRQPPVGERLRPEAQADATQIQAFTK
jgi:hypothetical protein